MKEAAARPPIPEIRFPRLARTADTSRSLEQQITSRMMRSRKGCALILLLRTSIWHSGLLPPSPGRQQLETGLVNTAASTLPGLSPDGPETDLLPSPSSRTVSPEIPRPEAGGCPVIGRRFGMGRRFLGGTFSLFSYKNGGYSSTRKPGIADGATRNKDRSLSKVFRSTLKYAEKSTTFTIGSSHIQQT